MSVLKVENLSASYRKNKVLYDVDFDVKPGSLTGIVGPNGAGKSTLLKVMLELAPSIVRKRVVFRFHSHEDKIKSRLCSPKRLRRLGFSDKRLGCRSNGAVRKNRMVQMAIQA